MKGFLFHGFCEGLVEFMRATWVCEAVDRVKRGDGWVGSGSAVSVPPGVCSWPFSRESCTPDSPDS